MGSPPRGIFVPHLTIKIMSLPINSKAPNFRTPSTSGSNFELSTDAAGQACILYFYPKDFTPVCTIEACEFKSTFDFFKDLDVKVYGISKDDIETHNRFKKAYTLPFDLLADPEGEIASLYGAYMPLIKFTKRLTFLLDANHQIIHISSNVFEDRSGIETMIAELKVKASQKNRKEVVI